MFCRCEVGFGEEPNTQTCPVCLAHPGRRCPSRTDGDRVDDQARARTRLRDRRARVFHRKNYFYPDNPKGYQISQYDEPLCIERAFRRARGGRRPRGRDRARAPRGGRGEERPRRRPAGRIHGAERDARRLQPGRHAARRDRHRARHPLGRAGEALPPAAPADGRRARHLRRRDGEGLASLRRQRLGAARPVETGFARDRAQEHELVQLRRAGDRARDRAADRDLRGRRPVEQETLHFDPRPGASAAAPLEGGGAGLPLLPRARPRPVEPPAELVERAARASPELPGARIRRLEERSASSWPRPRDERAATRSTSGSPRRPARGRERPHEPARRGRGRPVGGERRRARQADRGARPDPTRRPSSRRSRASADAGFTAEPLSRRDGRSPTWPSSTP